MGIGGAPDRGLSGQHLYRDASHRGRRGVYNAGTQVGASSVTARPDLVDGVVYAARYVLR
jgi:hypothetical protein